MRETLSSPPVLYLKPLIHHHIDTYVQCYDLSCGVLFHVDQNPLIGLGDRGLSGLRGKSNCVPSSYEVCHSRGMLLSI